MAADDVQPRRAFTNTQQPKLTPFVSVTNRDVMITEIPIFVT